MSIERQPFSQAIEHRSLEMRRLTQVELLGIDSGFSRLANPVGVFLRPVTIRDKSKLLAIVEFDDLFDLSGNRFDND